MTKKIFFIVILVSISLSSISQARGYSRTDYLEKSRNQKKAAFITLGCSAATLIPGIVLLSQTQPGWERVDWGKALGGAGLTIAGAGFAVSSIILFVSSDRNRKTAERMEVFINKPIPVNKGVAVTTLPYSVGVTIPIR